MTDPRHIAERIVGAIDWQTEVSGFCRCPGEALHTQRTGKKDCRVSVDGAPTIYCFHSSCAEAVATTNRRLRRTLAGGQWQIVLPDGQVLRSGDILRGDGTVLPDGHHDSRGGLVLAESHRGGAAAPPYHKCGRADLRVSPQNGGAATPPHQREERLLLETLRANAERFKPELFEFFHWPFAQIISDSPLLVAERDAEDQFRTWLKLWPAHSTVWIGDIYSSGKESHRAHFRPVAEWYQIGPVVGNFTCGSSFKPGSYQRSNANCNGTRFMVVESDTLPKDEVGAIFAYLNRRLHFNLHAIIDTAGKSLHGWFDAPRNPRIEAQLKAVLTVFGCDPKLFTYSQPVRVPGAYRDGKLQRLVWVRN
jgi:hypothetical protein